jgi:hypothetical protein
VALSQQVAKSRSRGFTRTSVSIVVGALDKCEDLSLKVKEEKANTLNIPCIYSRLEVMGRGGSECGRGAVEGGRRLEYYAKSSRGNCWDSLMHYRVVLRLCWISK